MATFAVGDVVRVTVVGTASQQAIVNIFYYAALAPDFDPINQGDGLESFLVEFRNRWRVQVLPLLAPSYQLLYVQGQTISGRVPDPNKPGKHMENVTDNFVLAAGGADIGTAAGSVSPTFEAYGIRFPTKPKTFKVRANNRIGPISEDAGVSNSLTIDALAAAQAMATSLANDLVIGIGLSALSRVAYARSQVVNRAAGGIWPTEFIGEITSGVANPFVTSQVSRKQRVRLG